MIGLEDFKEYLERYCNNKDITVEEAKKHKIVRIVGRFYGLDDDAIDDSSFKCD